MSSGFVSENELEERRKVRQAEWDKVRKPEDPKEAPEEEYDHRTLFERLEEQRQKKDMEYEETHKLKNMIRGLDDDEIEFLDMVDRTKMEQEKRLKLEEAKELENFRSKVAALKEKQTMNGGSDNEEDEKFTCLDKPFVAEISPQNKALANILKKRPNAKSASPIPAKKSFVELEANSSSNCTTQNNTLNLDNEVDNLSNNSEIDDSSDRSEYGVMKNIMILPSAMKCIGVLPGIGSYLSDDSSDSENTSGSEIDDIYSLPGKKVEIQTKSKQL